MVCPDWSSFPPELLEKVCKALVTNCDYVRFRAVCRSWRSASSKTPRHLPRQVPWLMLPALCKDGTLYEDARYGEDFLRLPENKLYHIDIPELYGKRCLGSSHGWLCLLEINTISISVFNPLTKAQIQLPSLTTVPQIVDIREVAGNKVWVWRYLLNRKEIYTEPKMSRCMFLKVILSENPTSNKYSAMIIYGEDHNVAFCKAGDAKWRSPLQVGQPFYLDGIYHKGQFYTIYCDGSCGKISVYNLDPCVPEERAFAIIDLNHNRPHKKYLVEVSGELLAVMRGVDIISSRGIYKTSWFSLYKFEPTSKEWIKILNLNDYALFLGMNHSFSLSAKDFPNEFKPNCIYFTVF